MTFPSSFRAARRYQPRPTPGPALPDGWPTQANGEPLLADLAFRDGRIAALTRPTSRLPACGTGGALTLPGLVEPAHLDKTFTIERCRPAQAGLLAAIHAMHEIASTGPGRIFNVGRPPRWLGRQQMV
jgi:cytosine deaminase